MKINKAIILSAGKGKRLRPLTKYIQKAMLPIGSMPNLYHLVYSLSLINVKDILFITGIFSEQIKSFFGNKNYGAKFSYIKQKKLGGTANALELAQDWTKKENFIFIYGDTFFKSAESIFKRVKEIHENEKPLCTTACYDVPLKEVSRRGILEIQEKTKEPFKIIGIQEKPKPMEAKSTLANAAIYSFSHEIFDLISKTPKNKKSGEYVLADTVKLGIKDGKNVLGTRLKSNEARYDIGNIEDYNKTQRFYLNQD